MDRVWMLTWTTYGTWLPGDDRGFVPNVRPLAGGPGRRHNSLGVEAEQKQRGLALMAREKLIGAPIYLSRPLAPPLFEQFQETARYRGWTLLAVGIMANHVHVVVGVLGDPEPDDLLRDFKSYGSRPLTRLVASREAGRGGRKAGRSGRRPATRRFARRWGTCGTKSTRC